MNVKLKEKENNYMEQIQYDSDSDCDRAKLFIDEDTEEDEDENLNTNDREISKLLDVSNNQSINQTMHAVQKSTSSSSISTTSDVNSPAMLKPTTSSSTLDGDISLIIAFGLSENDSQNNNYDFISLERWFSIALMNITK
jgi:hypothetical protein